MSDSGSLERPEGCRSALSIFGAFTLHYDLTGVCSRIAWLDALTSLPVQLKDLMIDAQLEANGGQDDHGGASAW